MSQREKERKVLFFPFENNAKATIWARRKDRRGKVYTRSKRVLFPVFSFGLGVGGSHCDEFE